jgi:site-specific recombinase XerD
MDLLRWSRFLWAVQVPWDRASPVEGRDFSLWMRMAAKQGCGVGGVAGAVNEVTGKSAPGSGYAASTVNHCETVLRTFYDFHREAGSGPMLNPFPIGRSARGVRAHAHHNPLDPWPRIRLGRYRSSLSQRLPRAIPDEMFDRLFAALGSHRDRALVAFWISTGARASELLGVRQGDVEPGQQLVTVVRKGSRAVQQLPASPDAFVWLRLYQQDVRGLVPVGRHRALWWTVRRPFVPLTYHAAHRMFERANAALGANWTIHDLRHSAAHRMARDPALPLTDVQWVLGHAHLTTTQLYLSASQDEIIKEVRAHHLRQEHPGGKGTAPGPGYDPQSLNVLFGRSG